MQSYKDKLKKTKILEDHLTNYKVNETTRLKLKDLIMKANQIKTDLMCPNYGYNLPCPNLLLRDYCPNNHLPAIKKAWQIETEAIMCGQKID